jgi:hypothetical protein
MATDKGGRHDNTRDGHRDYDPKKIVKPTDTGGKHSGGSGQGGKAKAEARSSD